MEIQWLKCFVTVADEGSFTKATTVLRVTQPSLSQAVAKLELELGLQLFHRNSRGVTLTREGETFIRSARHILQSVDDAHAAVANMHGLTAGTLNLIAMRALTTLTAEAAAAFSSAFPDVTLRIHAPVSEEVAFGRIDAGECDIGFARIGITPSGPLEYQQIAVEKSVALLPKDSAPGRKRGPITLDEVAQLPLIAPPRGTYPRSQLEQQFTDAGLPLRVAVESEHHESSIELVRGGVGAYLTLRAGLPAHADQIVTVRPLTPARPWPIGLFHRAEELSPAAAAFKSLALKVFTGKRSA